VPPLRYTALIHERLSTVLAFAYSWGHLHRLLTTKFKGEWKYLDKTINSIAPQKAIQAFIEISGYLRLLDDAEDISGFLARAPGAKGVSFGRVLKKDGSEEPLYLRDLTNKIAHAKDWKWDVTEPDSPKLICESNNPDRWVDAEIDIEAFAAFCGQLMH